MKTIYFEDRGQDFLEWDIDDKNTVIDSRPFQCEVWCGAVLVELDVGKRPIARLPALDDRPREMNYRVLEIRER